MAFGDGGPDSADASQVTAQTLAENTQPAVKTTQVTIQVLAEKLIDPFVTTSQVTAQSLVQQINTEVTTYQVTAQILLGIGEEPEPEPDIIGWTGYPDCVVPPVSDNCFGEHICLTFENRNNLVPAELVNIAIDVEDRLTQIEFHDRNIEIPPRSKCI